MVCCETSQITFIDPLPDFLPGLPKDRFRYKTYNGQKPTPPVSTFLKHDKRIKNHFSLYAFSTFDPVLQQWERGRTARFPRLPAYCAAGSAAPAKIPRALPGFPAAATYY